MQMMILSLLRFSSFDSAFNQFIMNIENQIQYLQKTLYYKLVQCTIHRGYKVLMENIICACKSSVKQNSKKRSFEF